MTVVETCSPRALCSAMSRAGRRSWASRIAARHLRVDIGAHLVALPQIDGPVCRRARGRNLVDQRRDAALDNAPAVPPSRMKQRVAPDGCATNTEHISDMTQEPSLVHGCVTVRRPGPATPPAGLVNEERRAVHLVRRRRAGPPDNSSRRSDDHRSVITDDGSSLLAQAKARVVVNARIRIAPAPVRLPTRQ